MKNVAVFCSDHICALGLIRALGEAGYKVECFCYGNNSDYILSSKYVSDGLPFGTCEEATSFLINEYPIKLEKPVLFTLPDPPAYHVDLNQEVLKEKFILFSAGATGSIVYWMDKKNISDLAYKHGLIVPWAIKLSKKDEIPDDIKYPVFVKSSNSTEGGKADEGVCFSKEELEIKKNKLISDSFIVMQFVDKVKEINYFGLSIKDHVYIDYHDVRERAPKTGYGYYNSFHLCNYDDLHNRMINMIKETHYQGLFDVEFLLGDDGQLYFTEVNFRVDGEIYKLSLGINLPAYWCDLIDLSKEELPERLETKRNNFVGMTELDDFRASVLSGRVNFFKWFWQFLTADRRMLFNVRDPKPALVKFWHSIKVRIPLRKK